MSRGRPLVLRSLEIPQAKAGKQKGADCFQISQAVR